MIRWLQKADGSKVLQFLGAAQVGWFDVPTEVEKPCDHAWDGLVYTTYPPQSKCRLCGEFYRVNAVPKPEPRKPREWWLAGRDDAKYIIEKGQINSIPVGWVMIKVREVLDDPE